MYRIHGSGILRLSDGGFIPEDTGNRDWVKYQEWLDLGNTPDPEFTQADLDAKLVQDDIAAKDILIKARMREIAIDELKSEGVLPVDYKEGALK